MVIKRISNVGVFFENDKKKAGRKYEVQAKACCVRRVIGGWKPTKATT